MRPIKDFHAKAFRRIRNAVDPKTNWKRLLATEKAIWSQALAKRDPGKKILIPTSTGGHEVVTAIESLLAIALTLRGADVHFLLCDRFLPACQMQTYPDITDANGELSEKKRRNLCDRCVSAGEKIYLPLGLPIHRFSDNVDRAHIEEAKQAAHEEQARAGALRFFARGDLDGEKHAPEMMRRYTEASFLTKCVISRLLSQHQFKTAVFHHGLYVPQGVIGDCARALGVDVVNWNVAYRRKCVIFSHGDTYHHTLMSEPVQNWESIAMSEPVMKRLGSYLKKRENGSEDWISFHIPQALRSMPADEFLKEGRSYALLLTNVLWDAQLHYPANAFANMMQWVLETITYFEKRTDLDLVIRVHPAEITGIPRSRQTVVSEINKAFPDLPPNVHIVDAGDDANTYQLAERADVVLVYGTKTGVELAARGIPVIVSGEAWIRNKGISVDVSSAEEYRLQLDRLPLRKRLNAEARTRANQYAYHFFFRRMIPLKNLTERPGLWPPLRADASSLQELMPGRDAGLDVICDGILRGSEFIYPDERFLS